MRSHVTRSTRFVHSHGQQLSIAEFLLERLNHNLANGPGKRRNGSLGTPFYLASESSRKAFLMGERSS